MSARTIQISTDVYAAIWAARKPGEDSEEAILCRMLDVKAKLPENAINPSSSSKVGFSDPRFGITLPENFEIFRTYKSVRYSAKALNGKWVLSTTGEAFPSLNQLSRKVTGKVENAWNNWYYTDQFGKRHLIDRLRKG
jgi:hypothetical protein